MTSYDEFRGPESYGSGSYPNISYQDIMDDSKARILLMGPRRSGKSSIERVVFHKMSPHETLFLESTNEVRAKDIQNNALVSFQILDFPGNFDFSDPQLEASGVFKNCGSLVYVIDGQDDEAYSDTIEYFLQLAQLAYQHNPTIHFDILIHKVDGDNYLNEDAKIECQRDLQDQIAAELEDNRLPIHPSFFLTSIYDHSIFEAFSKIVQKLVPQLSVLENLLDSLIAASGIEKAFLFDVVSKLYVATDSNPVDMETYELCSDMIDVVMDVSCIYGALGQDDKQAFDTQSSSVIQLSSHKVLYLREVNRLLALVCLMPEDSFSKPGLVEYNVACFKQGIATLFAKENANSSATSAI